MKSGDFRLAIARIPTRWRFLSANAVLGLLIWAVVIQPVFDAFANQTYQLNEAKVRGEAYRATIRHQPTVVKAQSDVAPMLQKTFALGTSEGSLKAALQRQIQGIAQIAGLKVTSIRAIEPRNQNSIWFLGAHVDLSGSIAAQRLFLQTTGEDLPLLFVESATFRIPAQTADRSQEPTIDGQYQIFEPALDYAPTP